MSERERTIEQPTSSGFGGGDGGRQTNGKDIHKRAKGANGSASRKQEGQNKGHMEKKEILLAVTLVVLAAVLERCSNG